MSITESAREEITDTVGRLRATFATGLTRPVEWRKGQLKASYMRSGTSMPRRLRVNSSSRRVS